MKDVYQKKYLMKTEYRCNNLLSRSVLRCKAQMAFLLEYCYNSVPIAVAPKFCSALEAPTTCNLLRTVGSEICDAKKQVSCCLARFYLSRFLFLNGQGKISFLRYLSNLQAIL